MCSDELDITRYVGLDVDIRTIMVGVVDAHQQILVPPRRVSFEDFGQWCQQHLTRTDAVVLEATGNAWYLYDLLLPHVGSVTVAHPLLVRLISSARVKTDGRDALTLARLLAAKLIPPVWVPPTVVREVRALIGHRERLVRHRTQIQNRLRSVLHRHHIVPPVGGLFTARQRAWWHQLALSAGEKLRVLHDLTQLDGLHTLVEEVDTELLRVSRTEPWVQQVPYLVQIPGIGVHTAMVLLAAIGDITRFASAKKLVGYSGLGASVHASGQTYRTGGITKQGRREIRTAMVEAAWVAVEHHQHWKAEFARLVVRLGKQKAIVAIARKLLVVVWHVLTKQVADRHADARKVALKFMVWARQLKAAGRAGLTTGAFVRQELERLALGEALTEIGWSSERPLRLPPSNAARARPTKQVCKV